MIGSPPENLIEFTVEALIPPGIEEPSTSNDAMPSTPAPEDPEDVQVLRRGPEYNSLASRREIYGAVTERVPPIPPYQPTLRRPRSKSPLVRPRTPSKGATPPLTLKSKKFVTFVNLASDDGER